MVYQVRQLQDICEAANPCKNGGICILNAPPSNYTCNCVGNYTGDTCEGIMCALILASKIY